MISKSQFIRRIYKLEKYLAQILDFIYNERYIEVADIEDKKEVYIVDTFPVRICENARKTDVS